jgi:hypothetical protein
MASILRAAGDSGNVGTGFTGKNENQPAGQHLQNRALIMASR